MATTLSYDEIVGTYKKGSVVRIKLVSFLTYNKVEFVPGPRLNLVCGPNGTGKSTILNAMCLGLGGEPKHLGRADDVREFIAHGKDRALVEIELAGAPGKQGHIFRRVMDRNKGSEKGRGKGASTFFSNGVQTTIREIRKIVAEEYNISIDNLCTFLPQDRVGSFSGFNSKQLLEETEKSLSGSQHLFETHQTLVALEKELHLGGNNVETMEKKLKKLEADFTNMEREKERMEERQEALEHVELLEQKIMWLKYDAHRVVALEKKAAKEAAKEQLKDAREQLAPLQERASLLETHVTQNSARFQAIDRNSYQAKQEINKQGKKYESHATEMDDVANTLLTVDEDKRKAAREATVIREKLHAAEEHLETFPDQTDLQAQIEAESQEFRTHAAPLREKKLRYSRATQDYREADERVKEHGRVLGQINDEKMNRRQRVFRAFPNLNKIHDWVQNNGREFRRPVWGPVGCEVDIKTNNAAAYLEQHVANHVFKAFVVECKEDYDLLYKKIRQELNMPINILTVKNGLLQPLERMYSEQKYQTLKSEHGVMGYLDESFTAPDPIMQALRNEGSVHRVLVGGDETQNSLDNKNLIDYLNQPEDGSGRLKTCCIFSSKGDKSYKSTCSISRYSGKPSLRVDDVNPPRFLGTGVNPIRKKKIETDLADAEKLAEDLKSQLRGMAEEIEGATNLHNEARARYEATKMKVEAVKKVAQKVDRMRAKLVQTDERANANNSAEKKRLLKQVMNRMKSAITAIESHAEGHSQWLQATFQTTGVRINEAIYTTDYRRVNNELQQAKQTYAHLEQALLHAADQLKAVKRLMNATLNECRSKAPLMDDEGNHLPLKAKLEELPVENMDEAVAALEDAQAKANSIDDNPDVMLQYEKLKGEIVEIKDELENLADTKDAKLAEIRRHQEPWESALENSLFKVNTLFAVYMSELGCAGQIVLRKGDTSARSTQPTQDDAPLYHFDQWGVEIQVKFREKAKMSVLSAQRHSGGERSVSTIMYLMALQELMVSPFRCVDEINQGLDERNERLVFKRIVKNSTQPPQRDSLTSHSGQYFLITPKLLPNLTDMEEEAVTVHVITNGSYTFENPLDWNPDKFVETAQNLQSAQKKRPSREDDSIVDDEQSPEPADKDDVEREREAPKSARKKKRRVS